MQSTQERDKNCRKKDLEDMVRPASKIFAMNCQLRLRLIWQEKEFVWMLIKANIEHTHALSPDSFAFI